MARWKEQLIVLQLAALLCLADDFSNETVTADTPVEYTGLPGTTDNVTMEAEGENKEEPCNCGVHCAPELCTRAAYDIGDTSTVDTEANVAISCVHNGTFALTFDDGPSYYTAALLDVLRENNVRATFYVVGRNALRHRDIVTRMVREGHMVAAHGNTHAHLSRPSDNTTYYDGDREQFSWNVNQAGWEIFSGIESVRQVIRKNVRHYRPAYYELDEHGVLLTSGLHIDMANCNTKDWYWNMVASKQKGDNESEQAYTSRKIKDYVAGCLDDSARQGNVGIIHLQHDIHERSVNAVQCVIDTVRSAAYRFVTMDECTGVDRYWDGQH